MTEVVRVEITITYARLMRRMALMSNYQRANDLREQILEVPGIDTCHFTDDSVVVTFTEPSYKGTDYRKDAASVVTSRMTSCADRLGFHRRRWYRGPSFRELPATPEPT